MKKLEKGLHEAEMSLPCAHYTQLCIVKKVVHAVDINKDDVHVTVGLVSFLSQHRGQPLHTGLGCNIHSHWKGQDNGVLCDLILMN